MTKPKNSLVANINRRKKAGTSRPKRKSTVGKKAYKNMERGWGKTARKKTTAKKKTAARKRTGSTGRTRRTSKRSS